MNKDTKLLSHRILVQDLKAVIAKGLTATVHHPHRETARQVCEHYYRIALENATEDEKKYLPIIQKRIERGNLSEILRERVEEKSCRTDFKEAIIEVYSELEESLANNQPYF
jgi:hypothetical protein